MEWRVFCCYLFLFQGVMTLYQQSGHRKSGKYLFVRTKYIFISLCNCFLSTSSTLRSTHFRPAICHHPICRFYLHEIGIYRNLLHGKYLVIYHVNPEPIEVLNDHPQQSQTIQDPGYRKSQDLKNTSGDIGNQKRKERYERKHRNRQTRVNPDHIGKPDSASNRESIVNMKKQVALA